MFGSYSNTKSNSISFQVRMIEECWYEGKKTNIRASGPITSWEVDGETVETVFKQTLFFWAPKSLQMVTVAMKLKDAYSLEGKL